MKLLRTFCLVLIGLFAATVLFAQGSALPAGQSSIGETMRSNGRIYVVVAVMLVILAGLVIYLLRLDRKISRLEKE